MTASLSTNAELRELSDGSQFTGRIGQYEIIRLLGRGGMGEVHLARDLRLGRLVAVKLLTTQQPDVDERVLVEARATARCHHENIVVIHEVGAHRGRPYMVLEYLEGKTLRQWLRDHTAIHGRSAHLSPARAAELMLPVVRALAFAHEAGIVHRDLKPENVMLTRMGGTKVLDFGIAKLVTLPDPGSPGARPGADSSSLAGTWPYMSPEQAALAAVDHRTDVWAAGIMLFELVAGAPPVLDAALQPSFIGSAITNANERAPELGSLRQVIERCLIVDPVHRTSSARVLLAELEALVSQHGPFLMSDGGNPFAGLAAFQEADAGRFFGRDRDIEHVAEELRCRPLLVVAGPSGAGKSSLVRAGVIPALKRSGEGWDAHIVRPGCEPLAGLAAILVQLSSEPGCASGRALGDGANRAVLDQLHAEPGCLGARLRAHATNKRRRIALFVDQLEELYTLGVAPAERAAFLACLAAAADDAGSPVRVLLSMRLDFVDRLIEDRRMAAEVARGLFLLPPMGREEMREALLRPVEAAEHCFESPALVDRMLDTVAATRGALPLLQFTAARLWDRRDRDRRLLTEASYEQLGGVAGALATHADTVLAGMSAADQALARAVFARLVTPERTRAVVSVAELHALRSDPAQVDSVLQHLTAMRLVVVERGAEHAKPTAELVHESLIDRWPTLVRWLGDNENDAATLARLRTAAWDWERSGHAPGLLWTGEVAREASAWRQRYRGELAAIDRRYLEAVLAASQRARRRRQRMFGTIVTAAVVTAIAMIWLAWQQTLARHRAAEEAMRARDATRIAAARALPGDPTTQLALLREIEDARTVGSDAAREARRLLYAGVATIVVTTPAALSSVQFSPDGKRIAGASADGPVRVWNANGRGDPLVLRGHQALVTRAAFSPDGERIVSASVDRTVRVWRSDGGGEPVVLRGHGDIVWSAAFSTDGQRVVSASADRTVRVWNASDGRELVVLRGHDATVFSAAFSPDGRRIVSASGDKTVRVWSADGRGEPLILRGHAAAVIAAAFSSDGRRIASGSWDRTVRIWSAGGSGEPRVLSGHGEILMSVAFSSDGQRIVSAAGDKTIRVWSADGSSEPWVLSGHDDRVLWAEFSPDGGHIVSTAVDSTVRVWNLEQRSEPAILQGHTAAVRSAAFSRDGRRIVSASRDQSIRVWNADGSGEPVVLLGHDDDVFWAEFSPDGQRIASASNDKTVRVWNADGHGEPLVLRGHDDAVNTAVFSADGQHIVSASDDGTVRWWNADGRGEPVVFRGHVDAVMQADVSPDGQRIVSSGNDKTVRVWSADGVGQPLVLRGHEGDVRSALFSPDGQHIVSASADHTVRVWRADGRGDPIVLRHHDLVYWAAFSPDGRQIVSVSRDKMIRIWQADSNAEPLILARNDLPFTHARFGPDSSCVVAASLDRTVRVWHDLSPTTLEDPRLWAATSYCMPVDRRIELLGVSVSQALRDRQRCLERTHQHP